MSYCNINCLVKIGLGKLGLRKGVKAMFVQRVYELLITPIESLMQFTAINGNHCARKSEFILLCLLKYSLFIQNTDGTRLNKWRSLLFSGMEKSVLYFPAVFQQ